MDIIFKKPRTESVHQLNTYETLDEKFLPKTGTKEYDELLKWQKLYGTFTMSLVECLRYKKFLEDHRECGKGKTGAIGGSTDIIFTPTSIGSGVSVRCGMCGIEENLTDYGCW